MILSILLEWLHCVNRVKKGTCIHHFVCVCVYMFTHTKWLRVSLGSAVFSVIKAWLHWSLPGSSPGGSRVIRRWGRSWRPGKNLFNYRYRGRLGTGSRKRGWIQPGKQGARKRRHGGISLSRNWPDFFIFQVCLYTFLLYIGMNTESRGGQQTWPLSQSGASYKIIQRSYEFHHLLAMRSADILWPFLIPVS